MQRSASPEHAKMVKFEIRPNEAANGKALLLCVLVLTFTISAIGIIFALQGAWLILPFAGIEIIVLLASALYVGLRRKNYEMLVISKNFVHITKRVRSRKTVRSFVKQWVRVELCSGRTRHEPSRLLVGASGHRVEIGRSLTTESKERLHRQLSDWLKS